MKLALGKWDIAYERTPWPPGYRYGWLIQRDDVYSFPCVAKRLYLPLALIAGIWKVATYDQI
jgi:hypothetical protein